MIDIADDLHYPAHSVMDQLTDPEEPRCHTFIKILESVVINSADERDKKSYRVARARTTA